jgi:hypothetical protein
MKHPGQVDRLEALGLDCRRACWVRSIPLRRNNLAGVCWATSLQFRKPGWQQDGEHSSLHPEAAPGVAREADPAS